MAEPMTRTELALGSITFIAVIAAGLVSAVVFVLVLFAIVKLVTR